jgi:tetratricopeptide (TPR) repeat protein
MDIILLNNNAVNLMQQGNFEKVASDFRAALAIIHRVDQQHEGVDLADKVTPDCLSVRSVSLENYLFHPSSHQDHHAISIFDRGLVIDDAKLAAGSSTAGQDCTTAIVLLNAALALHLQGRRNICLQQTRLKKALQLYRMAFDILEKWLDSGDEVNRLVYLAAVNNMGQIYAHFCEGSKAQHCLQLLYTMLDAMKSSGIDIFNDEYLPFSMNALILWGQEVAAAAAA